MIFWWRENRLSFEQECQFIKSMGFGVELWPNIKGQDECRYEKRNWPRLLAATEDMLVSMRSRNDDQTLEQWNEQVECAKSLNANIVTDLRSLGIPDGPEVDGHDFSEQVVKMAENNNVKLCLETGNLARLKQVGEKFDSLWYCLDTGYANLVAPRVAHLHLTDNYGQNDDHEPPGLRGGIARENWDYLLNTLNKYDNDVVGSLEMFPCMPAVMIRQACEFLFDELRWPNSPQKQPGYANATYNPA
jgi:sugar phosphate isomerase/epimerase